MSKIRLVVTAALFVAAASCGGAATSTSQAPVATSVPAQAPTAADAPPTPGEPSPADTTPTADLRTLGGLAGIELVDPAPGGLRPMLAWVEIPDAAYYRVVVLDGGGTPYWGWIGTDTSVRFGGADTDGGLTAHVHQPMTWSVAAIDDQGRTIALSEQGTLPGEG